MKKMKKKARYVSPRVLGASALLLDLLCDSQLRFNVQVKELENVNAADPDAGEYFEFIS